MTTQIIKDASFSPIAHGERIRDVLLVSSFALWAVLLGLAPVLAYRLLIAS
jgi:hypothetical protein